MGDVALLASLNAPARPKLELNAGVAPRVAQKEQRGEIVPAPEVGGQPQGNAGASAATLIAISATPAAPKPNMQPPQGNLAARVAVSPEGKTGSELNGAGVAGAAEGKNTIGISISGGNPAAKDTTSGSVSDAGAGRSSIHAPSPHISMSTSLAAEKARAAHDEVPAKSAPPQFSALPPGAAPERIFADKRMYKLLVNMPNLNSSTGSWVLNFFELGANAGATHMTSSELSGPVPMRKIDPKYPPSLINEHVEGEVVLYAVIRQDGSIDSIQLVQGLDEQLDANAMSALSQWKFRPASKQGAPVELEAIVHIPFHAAINR